MNSVNINFNIKDWVIFGVETKKVKDNKKIIINNLR